MQQYSRNKIGSSSYRESATNQALELENQKKLACSRDSEQVEALLFFCFTKVKKKKQVKKAYGIDCVYTATSIESE